MTCRWLFWLIFSTSFAQAQPLAPGLLAEIYELGQTPRAFPELLPGQLPSRLLTCKTLDLVQSGRRQDFAPDSGAFLARVSGVLRIGQAGSYRFRLSANDAARLSIAGKLLLEKDTAFGGSGGVFFRDTQLDLPPGDHALLVEHVNVSGPALLRLEWFIEGLGQYLPLPSEVLYHDSAAAPAFQPGLKRIYSPAARYVPGNGAPLAELHPAFDRYSLAPAGRKPRVSGMAFRPDGLLYYCSPDLPGEIWALEGGQGEGAAASARRFATGLNEPMGLAVAEDTLYVLQRQELTQVLDRNGDGQADEFRTVASWPAELASGEGASGLAYADGYFYAAVSGRLLRVARTGAAETLARPGAAWSLGAGAEALVLTESAAEGQYAASLLPGGSAVALPGFGLPGQPAEMGQDPYRGQWLISDLRSGGLFRLSFEQGQGCLYPFSAGLQGSPLRILGGPDGGIFLGACGLGPWRMRGGADWGLEKLLYKGLSVFDLREVRARSNGFELEFTEPLQPGEGRDPGAYRIRQWPIGGSEAQAETLRAVSTFITPDRRRVLLAVPGLRAGHIVHLQLAQPPHSEYRHPLWTAEAWYSLRQIPEKQVMALADTPFLSLHNRLTEAEKAAGWQLLFDGSSFGGWRNYRSQGVSEAWKIEEGAMTLAGKRGGDLISAEPYENFELSLDWRLEPGGNSGIFYLVEENERYGAVWETGPEYQLLDDLRHPDRKWPSHRSGSNYDLQAPAFEALNPPGTWNNSRIRIVAGHVEHWLNGYRVLEYDLWTPEWEAAVARSKFEAMPAYGKARSGPIALQDHGDRVQFRNIKLRKL